MPTDREVLEIVARCVSCMVFYRNCVAGSSHGSTTASYRNAMATEVRENARIVAGWGLDGKTDDYILDPVKGELIARYGLDDGDKLHREFVSAFRHSVGNENN